MKFVISPSIRAKVSSNRNFSKLFQYINGNNEKGESAMEFVLPSKYSERNAVLPKDKDVLVYISKPGYYAAIRFGDILIFEKLI
ncbi:MAG: heme-binding protein [Flavobacteriaceae bacterium]